MELVCRVTAEALVSWRNGVAAFNSSLQWSDGGVAAVREGQGRDLVYDQRRGEIVLRIHNLSAADYGVYQCQCVNEYSYSQFRSCGGPSGIPTYCAHTEEIAILPPGTCIYMI